jgi:hypothetical protein
MEDQTPCFQTPAAQLQGGLFLRSTGESVAEMLRRAGPLPQERALCLVDCFHCDCMGVKASGYIGEWSLECWRRKTRVALNH